MGLLGYVIIGAISGFVVTFAVRMVLDEIQMRRTERDLQRRTEALVARFNEVRRQAEERLRGHEQHNRTDLN